MDVFDGTPIRPCGVFVAAAPLSTEPGGHAHEACCVVFLQLRDHVGKAVSNFFEALLCQLRSFSVPQGVIIPGVNIPRGEFDRVPRIITAPGPLLAGLTALR